MPDDESEPLDANTNGTFDADLRVRARIAALDAAARTLGRPPLVRGSDPDAILVRAETFERWLLRGERPTS